MKKTPQRTPRSASPPKTRILIVDDHPITRQGLAQLVGCETDLEVCGEATDAREALKAVETLQPDLMLLDITLPDKSGLEVTKDIHAIRPTMPILVISMHDESLYAERVLRAGARGYIMKQEGGKKLIQAIRKVLDGKIYVSDAMASLILEIFSGHATDANTHVIHQLTDREFEVFQLIGQGKTTKAIAQHLHISVKTVEVHRVNIKAKLALKTSSELVSYAVRWVSSEGG